jgi:hypothetical protein
MKRRMLLLAALLLAAPLGATVRAADVTRFSQVLTAPQRMTAGLDRLTSDQLAVLDALVRYDDTHTIPATVTHPRPARFSQRLDADERHHAGLDLLSAEELARLDALVEQRWPLRAPVAAPVSRAPTSGAPGLTPEIERVRPQVHGSVTAWMGWGSGGYSEQGGAMDVDYYDPAHHFDVQLGYAEVHTKAPAFYRNCPDGFLTRRGPGREGSGF